MSFSDNAVYRKIKANQSELTPKAKALAQFIVDNPTKTVFLTTRGLAEKCGVSEATVVRFVRQIGYRNYTAFKDELRYYIDTGLSLVERKRLTQVNGENTLEKTVMLEINNLKALLETIDASETERIISCLSHTSPLYIIGSRISYHSAYYMGWAMTKIRKDVNILKGSDRTSIDWLTVAPENSVAVIIAVSRYPNELIRVGKYARQLGMTIIVLTDSTVCPLLQFAHHALVAQPKKITYFESPTSMIALIIYLLNEVTDRLGDDVKKHQEILEQAYRENDILFNLE